MTHTDPRLVVNVANDGLRHARRVGLISDTHGKLRSGVLPLLEGVDAIIHAGDIGEPRILLELATIAPVFAVHGNTDDLYTRSIAPDSVAIEMGGRLIVVAHGHLLGSPNPRLLREMYPACDVIVYGHTHKPLTDRSAVPLVVNPGAAGPARFNLLPSLAYLNLEDLSVELVDVVDKV